MKSLKKFRIALDTEEFDLKHESAMVQSRILSTLLEVIEEKGYTQADLAELTGLKQPFISGLFNIRKKLNMEHIAILQKALDIVLQPPTYHSRNDHKNLFYSKEEYEQPNYSDLYKKMIRLQKSIQLGHSSWKADANKDYEIYSAAEFDSVSEEENDYNLV